MIAECVPTRPSRTVVGPRQNEIDSIAERYGEAELAAGSNDCRRLRSRHGLRTAMTRVLGLAVGGVGGVLLAEFSAWRASEPWAKPLDGGSACAVVVLGYPSLKNGRLHPLQRWRTEIGARTLAAAGNGCLIFSGAATREGAATEAEVMAAYAVNSLGVSADRVQLEMEARNTWENLQRSLSLADAFDRVALASDPFHAARARRYAVRQCPDLENKLAVSTDYRFLERWWLKLPIGVYECAMRIRDIGIRRCTLSPHGGERA